jgi:hypothetical protein
MNEEQNSVDSSRPVDDPFAALYPNIAFWVKGGWIEIGQSDHSQSFVRALDEGGFMWEGETEYSSFHEALQAQDAGIAAWRGGQGF